VSDGSMKAFIRPALLGFVGAVCLLVANVVSRSQGDVTSPLVYRCLSLSCSLALLAGMSGALWAFVSRRRFSGDSSWVCVISFCTAVAVTAVWTHIAALPNYLRTRGAQHTSSPVSLSVARPNCPIPLPDSATHIQYSAWSRWIAHETYVRFEAPTSDCLEHASKVLQPYAKEYGSSVVSSIAVSPPDEFPKSEESGPRWFDLGRFSGGVVFGLSNHWGPVVWVDTNRQCFYFMDID
jgi:hypothetical protein